MKTTRFSGMLGVLVLVIALAAGQFVAGVQAQDGDQCSQLVAQALAAVEQSCAEVAPGTVCYGYAGVTAVTSSGDAAAWATSGDTLDLALLTSLSTSPAGLDAGEWGVTKLSLPAALIDGGTQAVSAVLFGEAQITRPAQAQAGDRPTLTVSNAGGAEINVRNGAGVIYDVIGQLAPGQSAVADARNQENDWVRIQTDDGMVAWVFVRLINWDGDLTTLPVLLPDDVTSGIAVTGAEPFQAFTLSTGPAAEGCDAASSGLLLQFTGDQPATLLVNQTEISFTNAVVLLHAAPGDGLDVMVMSGVGTVAARGVSLDAGASDQVRVALGGDDGLTPVAAPVPAGSVAFPDMVNAPVSLFADEAVCMVGVPSVDAVVRLRVGPGEQRGDFATMDPDKPYVVLGWAADPDGNPWWQLDTGDQKTWVAQSAVQTLGVCDAVVEVEPPPLVFAPPPVPAEGEGSSTVDDLAPGGNSVWQMNPGSDNMSGECSGAPAINFCDHLAAIAPAGGGISWKGMEASPYYLVQVQPNVYAYSGPNVLGTGTVNMTLRFTSETTLTMTQSLTLKSEPNCQHVYYYSGSRNW